MAVAHKDRIDRLNLLKQLIPRNCSDQGGPDARQLLARLAEHYEASKSDAARMRAIQRDRKIPAPAQAAKASLVPDR